MTVRPGERGAALLAVLMLVAVMGALAAVGLDRIGLATRLAANGAAADQVRAYAAASEAMALAQAGRITEPAVAQAVAASGGAPRVIRVAIPGGALVARLADGANCFNLNSVASGMRPDQLAARPYGIAQFAALMQVLGVPANEAQAVAAATADWIDADAVPLPMGAEDPAYAALATPDRTANRLMADTSELRAVAGVTPSLYATLRPFVCALPDSELSPLNVNTLAVAQAPLVAMLAPGMMTLEMARQLLASRPPQGWTSTSQFWAAPAMRGAATPDSEAMQQTQVRVRYVRAVVDIAIAGTDLRQTLLIDSRGPRPRVVARAWGDEA